MSIKIPSNETGTMVVAHAAFVSIFRQMKNTPHATTKSAGGAFVDASYLAKKYNVTGRYILQLAAGNRIPCIRLGPKCVRFSEAAVAAVLEGGIASGDSSDAETENTLASQITKISH